uniref:Uncharacterized protein n=1 Tax=Arundo donax TaxID=35708 RepID=A0A0A9GFY7_ARUDO
MLNHKTLPPKLLGMHYATIGVHQNLGKNHSGGKEIVWLVVT